ncbi:MAG TPA: ribosome biogenesis factor YjgA [Polyangiaceae bacterium]|nr:ribosome biogenesis factor YjgA [Polyangiaceae bacterium]
MATSSRIFTLDPPPEPDSDLPSRADKKREVREREERLMSLARQIVELSPRLTTKLELPDLLLEAVDHARRIPSAPAQYRALRKVRTLLRDDDVPELERRLADLLDPSRVNPSTEAVAHWLARLIGEGEPALDAIVEQYPNADRRQLRQLSRNVTRASEANRAAAEQALKKVLRDVIRGAPGAT